MIRSKYGNVKVGGHASKKENRRANELRLLQMAREISDLQEQVPYELIPAQYIDGKLVERSCKYVADFVYKDKNGNTVVEDTKGFRTADYIIKRKLMLKVHGIRIKEI